LLLTGIIVTVANDQAFPAPGSKMYKIIETCRIIIYLLAPVVQFARFLAYLPVMS